MTQSPVIVWFRRDLRLHDNPALFRACESGAPIICLYIHEEGIGSASKWWLHHSLLSLKRRLQRSGADLAIFQGDPLKILPRLISLYNVSALYWNRIYEPQAMEIERKLSLQLPCTFSYNGSYLFEPWRILNRSESFFKVFTPFWKRCLEIGNIQQPLPPPDKIEGYPIPSDTVQSLDLLPSRDWVVGIRKMWEVGEDAALDRLERFVPLVSRYQEMRNFPATEGSSPLSPYLHFGELSPRQVYERVHNQSRCESFLWEIGWREFSTYQVYHFPQILHQPWKREFAHFPWREDGRKLRAWQKGKTGYPIVDAGMRQLWNTGWMHNRVRMIVASFLTKDLLIDWRKGAEWFFDTLVDADIANNIANWQWVAGCGFDPSPFFRIFNPQTQGQKFDADALYIKQWVPELRDVPASAIHQRKRLPPSYPQPIVEHEEARKEALAALKKAKCAIGMQIEEDS